VYFAVYWTERPLLATKRIAPRTRDASRTAAALIDAARWLFSRRAYDQLGTRDIADRAGVDAALVHRYFGTKKKLFAKAIENEYRIVHQLEGAELDALPARFVELMVGAKKDATSIDATLLLVRSAASDDVRALLAMALEEEFIAPLAKHLGELHLGDSHPGSENVNDEQRRTRTAMTLAILAGFDLLRRVLKIDALNGPDAKVLLERAVRACLIEPEHLRLERPSR
jgi:AcrR family transcriptional regulator